MYYPKSQIKTNLTTLGGEFVILKTKEPFSGFYWKTSKGEFFTGKSPEDGVPLKLVRTSLLSQESHQILKLDSDHEYHPSSYYLSHESYDNARGNRDFREKRNPKSSKPKLGEKLSHRYFVSKTNEIIFMEVTELEYLKFKHKNPGVNWSLYQPIKLNWKTDGTQEEAYLYNKTQVLKQNILGFEQYFKGKFDNYWLGK